jgi:NADH-quinone oxidoreductase subunit N
MFIRILKLTSIGSITAVSQILFMVAVLSVIYGVLMAIKQKSIRRLIAYASIAHMGFAMLPIAISSTAYSYSLIYLMGYLLITVVAFAVMVVFSRLGVCSISDIRGLYYKMPHESFAFLLSLAAMAGIPPMVGFITKLNLFYLVVDSGHVVLAGVLAVCVVISAYYYMGLVRAMYFQNSIMESNATNYPVVLLSISLVVIGIIPQVFLIGLNQLV